MKKLTKKIAVLLLSIISLSCISGTLAACSKKSTPVETPDENRTVRYTAPTDGTLPTAHTAVENVGYLAYVLDNQPFYHAYAYNSSKAMGYEQITQSWRDYKSQALTNVSGGVTIASDITYSTFVRAGTQACFIGTTDAYMRTSSKPDKSTTSTTAGWSTDEPTYYDRDTYLTTYGEFSTEISVYLITADTIESSSDVTQNEDGTYSLTLYLTEEAACYYQYGMKTRGSLKSYPTFESIALTLTFDANWQILETSCVEKSKIAPSALGGIPTSNTAKTTTTFSYSSDDFDDTHFGYYESYYEQYVGNVSPVTGGTEEVDEPELITVLGSGFSNVLTESGQQFDIALTVGSTVYDGKIFLSIPDIGNVLSTIDVRVALEKSGSGKQDLYISFSGGSIDVYYSDDFALTASIDSLSTIISQVSSFISSFSQTSGAVTVSKNLTAQTTAFSLSGIDFNELLSSFSFTYTDTSVTIALQTSDLLGTGIGADIELNFSRTIADGASTYAFKDAAINSLSYNSSSIALSANITPDSSSSTISHNAATAPADLADYVSSVFGLLGSDVIAVNLALDGSGSDVISYLKGVDAQVTSYLVLGNDIALRADMALTYAGVSIELTAYYSIDLSAGDYGTVYLNLTKINDIEFDAKAYCDISDMVTAVKSLINTVTGEGSAVSYAYGVTFSDGETDSVAEIINKILNLNFAKLLSGLYANSSEIRVNLDLDELLSALGLDIGVDFGTAALVLTNGDTASMKLSLPALGLTADIKAASSQTVTLSESEKTKYLDLTSLVETVDAAAAEVMDIISAEDAHFTLDATLTAEGVEIGIEGEGEVCWSGSNTVVALDVTLSIAKTDSSSDNSVNVKLVYDSSLEKSSSKPYLRLAIGDALLDVYGSSGETAFKTAAASANSTSVEEVLSTVTSLLEDENIAKLLNIILGYAAQLDVALEGTDLTSLVIRYGTSGNLTVNTDGTLGCKLTVTDYLDLSADIEAGSGKFISSLGTALDAYTVKYSVAGDGDIASGLYQYILYIIDNASISELIGSGTYQIEVALIGDNSGISALKGVNVTAVLEYSEIQSGTSDDGSAAYSKLLSAEANVEFAVNGETVKATLEIAYYQQCVYISVKSISYGDELTVGDIGLNVRAGTDAIFEAVVSLLGMISDLSEDSAQPVTYSKAVAYSSSDSSLTETISNIAGIICGLIETDFNDLFTYVESDGVKTLTLDVDGLLDSVGLTAPDIGTVSILIKTGESIDASAKLTGKEAWLTLTATSAESSTASAPVAADYIDLDDLLKNVDVIADMVKATISEVNGIQTAKSVVFEVDGTVTINGTGIGIEGTGEADWSDSAVKVAVDATLYIADGSSDGAKTAVAVKLIYDGTKYSATATDPYLILAIDYIVLEVYYGDNFDDLISGITALLGTSTASDPDTAAEYTADEFTDGEDGSDSLLATLTDILGNEGVQSVIQGLLKTLSFAVNAFDTDSDGTADNYSLSAAIGDSLKLTYSAEGGLSAVLQAEDAYGVFALDLAAGVSASDGTFSLADTISNALYGADGSYTVFTMNDFSGSFTHLVYNYLYKAITALSAAEYFGSDSYVVEICLDGDSSGIEALAGISVTAELYYAPKLSGDTVTDDRVVAADLSLNISGTKVELSAVYMGGYIYISLKQVGSTVFDDINVKAKAEDVSSAVEELIVLLTETNMLSVAGEFVSAITTSTPSATSSSSDSGVSVQLTDLIVTLITLSYSNIVSVTHTEDSVYNTESYIVTVDIDALLSKLGVTDLTVGTLKAEYSTAGSIRVGITSSDTEWAYISAERADRRTYSDGEDADDYYLDTSDYMDIAFLGDFISDLCNTLVYDKDGTVYTMYSFTGSVNIGLNVSIISVTIKLDITTLTLGLDEEGYLYVSLLAHLNSSSVMGFTVTEERDIGLTLCYYDGTPYIAMGRDVGSDSEIYKVMTLEYLIDNMLTSNSPVRWLLGTSSTAWNLIVDNIGVSLSSGLTSPSGLYLYSTSSDKVGNDSFSLSDYIGGILYNKGGDTAYSYGSTDGIASRISGVNSSYDNYYGFLLTLSDLTGGVLDEVYAAVIRGTYTAADEENGLGTAGDNYISGLALYTAISSYVTVSVDLGTYLEGVTTTYGSVVYDYTQAENVTASDFYVEAEGLTEEMYLAGCEDGVEYFTLADGAYTSVKTVTEVTDEENNVTGTETTYEDFDSSATYYVFSNTAYYVKADESSAYTLAAEYSADATYYTRTVSESSYSIGEVAAPNYLVYAVDKYGIDFDHEFTASADGTYDPIFGCYSSEDNSYASSDVLKSVTLTVYDTDGTTVLDEYTLRYGSTVYTVDYFNPVWYDEAETQLVIYNDGNNEYIGESFVIYNDTAIYKSYTSDVVKVTLNTGVNNSNGNEIIRTIAVVKGDEIPDYTISGYVFLGWYSDSSRTSKYSSAVSAGTSVYGLYVTETVTDTNGITYTLTYNSTYGSSDYNNYSYWATSFSTDSVKDGTDYTGYDAWLYIADEINGIPVTAIAADAFKGALIKNVLVPASVVYVGTNAFTDNYDMRTAVFLADSVYLDGGGKASKNSVFYGCSVAASGTTTNLNVYYNTVEQISGNNFAHFRRTTSFGTKDYYIGSGSAGGSLVSSGWAFVEYSLAGAEGVKTNYTLADFGLTAGVITSAIDTSSLQSDIFAKLNALTAESESYINGYTVAVSAEFSLDGKKHTVTVTFTANENKTQVTEVTVSYVYGSSTESGGTAKMYSGASLPSAGDKDGYTFIGWYTDSNCTSQITSYTGTDVTTLYGLYAQNSVTEDGVVYTFSTAGNVYSVTGYTSDLSAYYSTDSWLTLKNEIDGFKVTSIAASAFKSASLKNVIVPENIVSVGTNAFTDNYDIRTVVFLADSVYFNGTRNGKTYPFYGCSVATSGVTTNLSIYYTEITASETSTDNGVPYWAHFRTSSSNYRYIGHNGDSAESSLNSPSYYEYSTSENSRTTGTGISWSLVTYTVAGAYDSYTLSDLLGLTESDSVYFKVTISSTQNSIRGIITGTVPTDDELASAVTAKLDSLTAGSGYINYYGVAVSTEDGVTTITVSQQESLAYYKLTISSSENSITVVPTYSVDGTELTDSNYGEYVKTYSGETYVKYGVTVTLSDSGDTTIFTRNSLTYTYNGTECTYDSGFAMPGYAVSVSVTYKATYAENVYVYSAVNFTYASVTYTTSSDGVKLTNAAIGAALNSPVANGYYFVGWATAVYDTLTAFTGNITESDTAVYYYALWAMSREEVSYTSSGVTVTASMNENYDGSVYGWYAYGDSSFTGGALSTESNFTFTTSNTAVRVRLQYSLTVQTYLSGNVNSIEHYINGTKQSTSTSNGVGATVTVNVPENAQVYVYDCDGTNGANNKIFAVYLSTDTFTNSELSSYTTTTIDNTTYIILVSEIKIKAKTSVVGSGSSLETKGLSLYVGGYDGTKYELSTSSSGILNNIQSMTSALTLAFCYIRS